MNLSLILEGKRMTQEVDVRFEASELEEKQGIRYRTPLYIKGMIRKKGDALEFSGALDTRVAVACARCLAEVEYQMALEILVMLETDEERAWEAEYDSFVLDGSTLDLTELAHRQILEELPQKPLCDADCKGLCSVCGADLNRVGCTCKEEQTDSRFDILKQLLE